MITIDFRHIALFVPDRAGTTVLFPKGGKHAVSIDWGQGQYPLKGMAWFDARDANGASLKLGDAPLRDPHNLVHSLSVILKRLPKLKARKAADAIASGRAQAAIRLSGGELRAVKGEPVVEADRPYMNADWTFGPGGGTRKLTNRVLYSLPTERRASYWLVFGDGTAPVALASNAHLIVRNEDPKPRRSRSRRSTRKERGRQKKVVLKDFLLLYNLLEHEVKGPAPETPEIITAKNPERPLCPVGEP